MYIPGIYNVAQSTSLKHQLIIWDKYVVKKTYCHFKHNCGDANPTDEQASWLGSHVVPALHEKNPVVNTAWLENNHMRIGKLDRFSLINRILY